MNISGKIRGFVLLLLLVGVVVWLVPWGQLVPPLGRFLGEKESKYRQKDFEFQPVERRDIHQKVLATGTVSLKTGAEVKIGARISGKLEDLKVEIGDFVLQGDPIAQIEHQDLAARVAQFRADLRAQKARLRKTREEGPLEIKKTEAEIEELEVQLRIAEKNLQRNLELNKKGVVSEKAVDDAIEKVEVLRAKLKLAREDLKLKTVQLENDVRLAEAQVAKARAILDEEETRLSYATITAPIDGVVAYISTQEGETVVAGLSAPTFVTLIDLRKLEVTVFVDETDIGRVRVDQEATFAVDAYPEKTFRGTVREIHPKAVIKENVVNYEVILEIDRERRNLLRPEMTANVIIITGTHPDVLALPREAVKRLGPKTFAIVKTDGMLEERTIETGWRDGDFIEVVSGLEAGLEVGIPKKPQAAPVGVRRR